jgi:hypothetical protein
VAKKFVIGVGRVDTEKLHHALDLLGARGGEGRSNVVMVRLTNDALARVDQLVEATLVSSRSEAAAVLIGAGIESQKELFERLSSHTDEIRKLKEQLRKVALDALKPPTEK